MEARFLQKVLSDPKKHRQLLYETQTENDLNQYYQTGDTSAASAPWATGQPPSGTMMMVPPPPPPRKKKKQKVADGNGSSASVSGVHVGKASAAAGHSGSVLSLPKESLSLLGKPVAAVKKAAPAPSLGLVSYDSD